MAACGLQANRENKLRDSTPQKNLLNNTFLDRQVRSALNQAPEGNSKMVTKVATMETSLDRFDHSTDVFSAEKSKMQGLLAITDESRNHTSGQPSGPLSRIWSYTKALERRKIPQKSKQINTIRNNAIGNHLGFTRTNQDHMNI